MTEKEIAIEKIAAGILGSVKSFGKTLLGSNVKALKSQVGNAAKNIADKTTSLQKEMIPTNFKPKFSKSEIESQLTGKQSELKKLKQQSWQNRFSGGTSKDKSINWVNRDMYGKKIKNLQSEINDTRARLSNETIATGEARKFTDDQIKDQLKGDYDNLAGLKSQMGKEKWKTLGANAGLAGGAGAIALGASLSPKKKEDEQIPDQMTYLAGEDKDALIEKMANAIVGGIEKKAGFRSSLIDAINFNTYRKLRKDINALSSKGSAAFSDPRVASLAQKQKNIQNLERRSKRLNAIFNKDYSDDKNVADTVADMAGKKVGTKISQPQEKIKGPNVKKDNRGKAYREVKDPSDPTKTTKRYFEDRKQRMDKLRNLNNDYNKVLPVARQDFNEGLTKVINDRDNALAKSLALYGGVAGTGAGAAYLARKKSQKK